MLLSLNISKILIILTRSCLHNLLEIKNVFKNSIFNLLTTACFDFYMFKNSNKNNKKTFK